MSRINKDIAVFIIVLLFIVLAAIFMKTSFGTKTPIDTKTPVNTGTPVDKKTLVDTKTPSLESQVAGLFIEFEDGTTQSEIKAILENCNMTMNYSIDYNTNISPSRYYVKVDNDKKMDVIDELRKGEKIPDPSYPPYFKKGDYYVIVTEQGSEDENFLKVMEKNNLQVKKTIVCFISFGNEPKNWIPEKDAVKIRDKLEENEKVLIVNLDYVV